VVQGKCGTVWCRTDVVQPSVLHGECGTGQMWSRANVVQGECGAGRVWCRASVEHGSVVRMQASAIQGVHGGR